MKAFDDDDDDEFEDLCVPLPVTTAKGQRSREVAGRVEKNHGIPFIACFQSTSHQQGIEAVDHCLQFFPI